MRNPTRALLVAWCAALSACALEGDGTGTESRAAVAIHGDASSPFPIEDAGGHSPGDGGPPRDAAPTDAAPPGADGGGNHDGGNGDAGSGGNGDAGAGDGDAGSGNGDAGAGDGDAGAGDGDAGAPDGGSGPPDGGPPPPPPPPPDDFQPSCVDSRLEDQDGYVDGESCEDYDLSSYCVMTSGCPNYCITCTDGTSTCYPCEG